MFKIGTFCAALVAAGLFSSSAFATGETSHQSQAATSNACPASVYFVVSAHGYVKKPVTAANWGGCSVAKHKHHVAKHKQHVTKHTVKKATAAKSCVYFVDSPMNPYTGQLPLTAANFGGC